LGPRCPTECQCSCQEKRSFQERGKFSIHDFTYLSVSKIADFPERLMCAGGIYL
jgi:hypothetical protein